MVLELVPVPPNSLEEEVVSPRGVKEVEPSLVEGEAEALDAIETVLVLLPEAVEFDSEVIEVEELEEVELELPEDEEAELIELVMFPENATTLLFDQSATHRFPEESKATPVGNIRLAWLVPGVSVVNPG